MKTCTRCAESKPAEDFYKTNRGKGLSSKCKPCHNAYTAEYQKANPIVFKRAQRQYYRRNADKKIEDAKDRYYKKRDEILARMKAAREKDPEKSRQYQRDLISKNPNRYKEYQRAYYLAKKQKAALGIEASILARDTAESPAL